MNSSLLPIQHNETDAQQPKPAKKRQLPIDITSTAPHGAVRSQQ
jgi:hypothetical protein